MNKAVKYFKNYSEILEDHLNGYLETHYKITQNINLGYPSVVLRDFITMCNGGKRIRAGLVQLAYDICSEESNYKNQKKNILDIATAIEIFHASILIHDDIIDRAEKRRNIETIHSKYSKDLDLHFGESIGICGGDLGFYFSWDLIMKSANDSDIIIKLSQLYSQYCIRLVYGQILDIAGSSVLHLDENDVLNVYKYKTAEYTGVLPLLLGYELAKSKNEMVKKSLEDYGYAIGWIFQIQDDIIDIFSFESNTGKKLGKDIEEGKNTLMMIYFDKFANDKEKSVKDKYFGKPNLSEEGLSEIKEILMSSGSLNYVQKIMNDYIESANSQIPQITHNLEYQIILRDLIEYISKRQK